jgi:hypothetical protein
MAKKITRTAEEAFPHLYPQEKSPVDVVKESNPKDAIGNDKMPLHLWPNSATSLGVLGMLDGAGKYGRANWRFAGVRASTYYDALRRHMDAWFEGEDYASDSGVHHLGHALACLAILVDAGVCGKLVDDRMYPGDYRKFIDQCTPHVRRIKSLHAAKHPHHFTIADTPVTDKK